MCVEEGRVRVDVIQSARSIANQNKTFNYNCALSAAINLALMHRLFHIFPLFVGLFSIFAV